MRTVDAQLAVVPLQAGMNQQHGTRGAPPGTLYRVVNCRVDGGGLVPRAGTSAITGDTIGTDHVLSDTASVSRPAGEHPSFIGTVGGQRIAGTTAGFVFGRAESKWAFQGSFSAAQPIGTRKGIMPVNPAASFGANSFPAVACTSDGYICYAAANDDAIKIVVESPDGEVIYRESQTGTNIGQIVALATGSTLRVIYRENATDLKVFSLAISSGAVSATGPTTLSVTMSGATAHWDASAYDATTWYLVAQNGATQMQLFPMTGTTAGTPATWSVAAPFVSLWADPVGELLWVGTTDTSGGTTTIAFRAYDATNLTDTTTYSGTIASASTFTAGPPLFGPRYERSATTDAFFVYSRIIALPTAGLTTQHLWGGQVISGTATAEQRVANVFPVSKPDVQQRVWVYTWADSDNISVTRLALLRFSDPTNAYQPNCIELSSPEMLWPGDTYHPRDYPATHFHAVASTGDDPGDSAFFAFPWTVTTRTTETGKAGEALAQVRVYEYSRSAQEPHREFADVAGVGVVSGQPTQLFGRPAAQGEFGRMAGAAELGYLHPPTILRATTSPDASGVEAGSYTYRAVYEWSDNAGRRHLSAPSDPVAVTLTVASEVTLDVVAHEAGQKTDPSESTDEEALPRIIVYRTRDGGQFHHAVPIEAAIPGAVVGYLTAVDDIGNSTLAENEILYTEGGVLANVLAPSCRYLAAAEERLWVGGLFDANIIEASKRFTPGEPINFTGHPTHQVILPEECTGLAYLDGQVLAFAENAIYSVSGDGPNNQGQGQFSPARAIVQGIGCPRSESASILETEIGVIFRSIFGFYLIPRGVGTPQYIGGPVETEPVHVLSATVTATSEQRMARFLVTSSGGTKSDTVLAFDLVTAQWFVDEYTVDGSITGQGFSELGAWPDGLSLFSYGLERTDNLTVIWAEAEGLTADAGATGAGASTAIAQSIQTAWQFPFGQGGWGSMRQVMASFEVIGNDTVTIQAETDGNSVSDSFAVTAGSALFFRGKQIATQKANAWRATLSTAGGAAGVRFLSVVVEGDAKGGMRPWDASERT